jgi:hypothetical protein
MPKMPLPKQTKIRPTIMVRERANKFITNFNISDHDFALNIDAILLFKENFEKRLASQR